MLQTKIKNKETKQNEIKGSLFKLGQYMGEEILGTEFSKKELITTNEGYKILGLSIEIKTSLVISTKEDYDTFAAGISNCINGSKRAYIGFENINGIHSIMTFCLPGIESSKNIDTVIIAKVVLANRDVLASILRKVVEKYRPQNIIVCSIFYTEEGINKVHIDIPDCTIYVCGKSESNLE